MAAGAGVARHIPLGLPPGVVLGLHCALGLLLCPSLALRSAVLWAVLPHRFSPGGRGAKQGAKVSRAHLQGSSLLAYSGPQGKFQ